MKLWYGLFALWQIAVSYRTRIIALETRYENDRALEVSRTAGEMQALVAAMIDDGDPS